MRHRWYLVTETVQYRVRAESEENACEIIAESAEHDEPYFVGVTERVATLHPTDNPSGFVVRVARLDGAPLFGEHIRSAWVTTGPDYSGHFTYCGLREEARTWKTSLGACNAARRIAALHPEMIASAEDA